MAFQRVLMLPLFHHYIDLTVEGLEHLEDLTPPVIFAANHTSHLDAITIAAGLPGRWRKRVAPAMLQEHFRAIFDPGHYPIRDVWLARLQYVLARALLNAYPLPQQMSGLRRALACTGTLVSNGYCPLVFPEGARTSDGAIGTFKPGIGMMSTRLNVPVVPIRLTGLFSIYSIHHKWPQRGPAHMSIGKPLRFSAGRTIEDAAHQIEAAVRVL
jgi:long-chain acyl-CoA synthetase